MKWNNTEVKILSKLTNPDKIQQFLDNTEYNSGYDCKSPRNVLYKKTAHCMEGALFAASALRNIGYDPLIVDMVAHNDDDHVIAVFRENNLWGAVAKSNFTTLRFREPVYRSVRELIMSYFDFYFNVNGYKSLRAYSVPFNLSCYDHRNWETTDEDLDYIGVQLGTIRHYSILNNESISKLNRASEHVLKAGLLGSKQEGLFTPEN